LVALVEEMLPHLSYTLFMLAALAVFVFVRRLVPKPPALDALPWWKRISLALAGFIGGAFGAKVPFLFRLTDEGWLSLWLSDGKTITTGLIGAYLGVELAKLALEVRVKTGDTFALPLALALTVGRWGCFCTGCCFGRETALPWGVEFNGDGVLRHPTQIYESVFHLLAAAGLIVLMSRGWLRTHLLQAYLIAYGVYRLLTEYIRPEPVTALGFTFYQWVSLILIGGMALQWGFESIRLRLALPCAQEGEPIPATSER
jgi:phosphatidylglycerol:prolipoprotein diacylglycerol transferase